MDQLPYVDIKLLEYLELLYPDKCPDPSMSDRELWQTCGAVQLVRHLRSVYQEQQNLERGL